MLLLLFGIIDFGFMFQRYVVLTNAAMEGARVGILPGYALGDAEDRAETYATTGGVPGTVNAVADDTVTLPEPGGGTWPGVQVVVTHTLHLPLHRSDLVDVRRVACRRSNLTARGHHAQTDSGR